MTLQRFKWFQSVNCFQTIWVVAPLFKAVYKYIPVISINNQAADGEFLDLCLKNVQENSVYEGSCFERKIKKEIKLNSEHFILTCFTWNTVNTNWRIKYFFWYCLI